MNNDFKTILEKYKKYTRECKKQKIKAISLKEFIEKYCSGVMCK